MRVLDWVIFRLGVFPAVKSNRVENAPCDVTRKIVLNIYIKSSQSIFIQEIHIRIKYIGKTEARCGLFVPSVSEFNKIYNNLFVDQQTK